MKRCQEAKKIYEKKYLFFALIFIFIFTSFFSYSKTAYSASASVVALNAQLNELTAERERLEALKDDPTKIQTIDAVNVDAQILAIKAQEVEIRALIAQNDEKWSWEKLRDKLIETVKENSAVAYRSMLKYFLNTLAYDTATYLATGDKGQLPMFETQGWGDYLKNTADNAAGVFLETLGKSGPIKFNLCTPNPDVMLRINLGLQNTYRPRKPACTFSEMTENWDAALKDKDFLPKFQDMFNPWSNDLGIALTLQTGMEAEISKKVNDAIQTRTEGQGFKSVTDAISDTIKTPAGIVRSFTENTISKSGSGELVYTGNTLADAIDIFINTLAGKMMNKWLAQGLVPGSLSGSSGGLTDLDAQSQSEGIAGAENRFKSLIEPNFKVRGDYNILSELATCPDPNKAGPTNCVIDQKFREAIEKRLTVKQAMDQGYLSANGVFGFMSDGLEPRYNEGYPYRSMLILRKFRIIPVGWEIAAQKIKDNQGEVGGTKNLSDLVNCTAAWCAGLVDPNWVLKAEQNFCKKEGAGPEILSEQVTGEGTASSLSILRNDTYCADEQSCIKENSGGSCQLYGYCTEERRKWDFNGKSCEARYNTCQTFQSGDQTVSYLENTLDYGDCSAANAGCREYATAGSYSNGVVNWDAGADSIYLNKNAETCDAADQGCHGFIRIQPDQDETYADIKTAGLDAAYDRFSASGLIYEKLLPDYLKTSCYDYDLNGKISDGRLLANAPAACNNFVRECKAEEAGCELYTNAADGAKIPAKAAPLDYCPAECVGYETFIQKATSFELSRDAYFIPKTASACSAEAVGCEQFTNLDEVAKGGEGIEYYTSLKQCLKKTGNEASCGEFYTWEGSDESGYQLKVASLKVSGAEPAVTENDSTLCTEEIYNLPPSNPAHNADCRQFYNRQGGISYHLYNRTISCSDDCHPYRKTVASGDTAASCAGGGVWDGLTEACIYMAIPGQGAICSARESGCREYTGNTGNDVRNIFTDDFSGGTTGGWVGVNGSTALPSSEALTLDSDNKGNSLSVSGSPFSASRLVGGAVTEGKSYVLSFVAKAAAPTDLNLSLVNASGVKAGFAKVSLGAGWQIFQTNLADLNHEVTADEIVLLEAGRDFYIDNITLTEIVDKYYLIKNSWQTPASCDQELDGTAHDYYMLGCGQYSDRADKTHYLKSFSELCSESAVGCELMIDTKNSTTTTASFYKDGQVGTASDYDLTVPADSFVYAVYDKDKQCNAEAKGCAMLGKLYQYDGDITYGDVFLKNNPDKYGTILCGADAVGCEAFAYDKGEKYFKDPGDMVCEWRQKTGAGESYDWFKKKVKRCDDGLGLGEVNGKIDAPDNPSDPYETDVCLSDANCSIVNDVKCSKDGDCRITGVNECQSVGSAKKCSITGNSCNSINDCASLNKCLKSDGEQTGVCRYSCITDNNDYKCETDETKTLGLGGAGGKVSQPSNWAGICAAADSGCGEYIDPVSKFNNNLIFNGNFQKLAVSETDGWIKGSNANTSCLSGYCQNVTLEPNTVYRLAREVDAGELTKSSAGSLEIANCAISNPLPGDGLYKINSNNSLDSVAQLSITVTKETYANSKIFYYKGNAVASCTITAGSSAGAVELKPAVIDYQLVQNLDSTGCNGIVDFDKGCVLFNERSQDGSGLAKLTYDANTANGSPAETGVTEDSNIILKVTPDRTCDKWLACRSYIKDEKGNNTCYDVGLCDAVDDKGDCTSFLTSPKINQTMGATPPKLSANQISNLSGYAKVGITGGSIISDYYAFGAMKQEGEVVNLANGGFEYYGTNGYPVGWSWSGQADAKKSWDGNVFSVINNPISAQAEGIGYAREGASFLKLGSSYDATSEEVDVMPNTPYIITAYVNTKNLKSGVATIDIDGAADKQNITQDIGNDWQFKVGRFTTGDNSRIKIKLYASVSATAMPGSEGNFYFDDVKIRPALNSKTKVSDCLPGYCVSISGGDAGKCNNDSSKPCSVSDDEFWYTTQSCRLYPETDSMSCDYYEDSGARQKGWYGYCLEYDRAPGNPDACILWYPVDKVKGDGIEEGAGYQGKSPVYYCIEAEMLVPLEYRRNIDRFADTGCDHDFPPAIPSGYTGYSGGADCGCEGSRSYYKVNLKPSGACLSNCQSDGSGWYIYNGYLNYNSQYCTCAACTTINEFADGIKFYDPSTKQVYDDTFAYCSKVVETVNNIGDNKYWASRVYNGSDWKVYFGSQPVYQYNTNEAPFGSIAAPSSNPYDWDGDPADGIQPLPVKPTGSDRVRASSPYKILNPNITGGYTLGVCSGSDKICLNIKDSAGNVMSGDFNKADCASGEGICRSVDFSGNPAGKLQLLFAKSYGSWSWNALSSRYLSDNSVSWGPPGTNNEAHGGKCWDNTNSYTTDRSKAVNSYCAVLPYASNIKINGLGSNVNLTKNGFINLNFNTKVDSNQLPLVMYAVDWGDGEKTTVTGVEMRDRPNPDIPHSMYHLYSYWDLKAKANSSQCPNSSCSSASLTCAGGANAGKSCIDCSTAGECKVKPKVQIKDNWGWCNHGATINACGIGQWDSFGGYVTVKEK